jgi:hypothetical protein
VTAHIQDAIDVEFGVRTAFINCKVLIDNLVTRLVVLIICRNPTLSYTQRLEQKLALLEAALKEAKQQPNDKQGGHALSVESAGSGGESHGESSRSIEDQRVDADEGLPLNGSISLFQLPSSVRTLSFEKTQAEQEAAANRETLVNSAWQERVYERLWDTPVRS